MIKKNDILIFSECLEQGDEYALMIALDDEFTPSKVPMVKVKELNTDLPLPPINVFEESNRTRRKRGYPRDDCKKISSKRYA